MPPPTEAAIYLDHAATTPPAPEVVEAMGEIALEAFGNPSSRHGFGEIARRRLDDARDFLRGSLCAADLVLTSGGTEADVLGITGAARARPPGRVLVGAADHAAVLAQRDLLAGFGHRLQTIAVTETGSIDPEVLYEQLGRDVRVVALLHGHNELGTLLPLDELVSLIRHVAPEAHVHVDLVQAYGKVDFDLDLAGVDSVAVSGHKLHGPRGVGFLALSSKARIVAFQQGGGQEGGLRGGTENVAGAVGLAVAAERMLARLEENRNHMESLLERFLETVQDEIPGTMRLGDPRHRLPHVLSMRIPGVVGASLQQRLAHRGVAVSTGSACHEGGSREGGGDGLRAGGSSVLSAVGLDERAAREVVRVSVGTETTVAEIETAAQWTVDEAERLLATSVSGAGRRRGRTA